MPYVLAGQRRDGGGVASWRWGPEAPTQSVDPSRGRTARGRTAAPEEGSGERMLEEGSEGGKARKVQGGEEAWDEEKRRGTLRGLPRVGITNCVPDCRCRGRILLAAGVSFGD